MYVVSAYTDDGKLQVRVLEKLSMLNPSFPYEHEEQRRLQPFGEVFGEVGH